MNTLRKPSVPPQAVSHLATHGLEGGAPKTNDDAIARLIEGEDSGCQTCTLLLDCYMALEAETSRYADSRSGAAILPFRSTHG